MIHADFPNSDFVLRRRLQNCSREANMIIEIAFCFRDSKTASQDRRGKIFRACFAVASRNRDYLERQRFSIVASELLVRVQSIFRSNEREVLWNLPIPVRLYDRPAAPAFAADSTKLCPSKFSPRKATNNSPRFSVRESVLTLSTKILPSPAKAADPANSAIFSIGVGFIINNVKDRQSIH